jgi:hypothetical protein
MKLTGEEIRLRGLAALRRELGRAGLVRFLQHFEAGTGNYARQREQNLSDPTMDGLRRRVAKRKKKVRRRR